MNFVYVAAASLLVGAPIAARAQSAEPIPIDVAKRYFAEARALCTADGGRLWGVSLCGPIMFVDAASREIVASEADARGVLKAEGGVFAGVLPADQNVANTAVEGSGVRWKPDRRSADCHGAARSGGPRERRDFRAIVRVRDGTGVRAAARSVRAAVAH